MLGIARQLITDGGYDFEAIMAAGRIAPEVTEAVMDAASTVRPKLQFVV
ncbi:hypothetical protein HMPREF0569_1633 [Micrococcus luteus SK58]|nr:hypothetical protein [Micrococcus luteus]EFD50298.1 hypothetical protein HMPREF0569_1631 [Micrococcus luteus SK58]EFD51781.1 hypothetical protein HMPREF0569_1633 [Micrococcus luteus SK58]